MKKRYCENCGEELEPHEHELCESCNLPEKSIPFSSSPNYNPDLIPARAINKYVCFDIETTGLDPWYGDRVTCICAKTLGGDWFRMAGENESWLIQVFLEWLYSNSPKDHELVTMNGKHFDVPFILARAVLLKFNEPFWKTLLQYPHFDLAELTSKPVSLNNLAKLFGLKPKTGTGKDAIKLWNQRKLAKLKSYCTNDVELTEQIYLKHKKLTGDGM